MVSGFSVAHEGCLIPVGKTSPCLAKRRTTTSLGATACHCLPPTQRESIAPTGTVDVKKR